MCGIDHDGAALVHDLEKHLEHDTLSLAYHARMRRLRKGSPNFIRNLLIPMVRVLLRHDRVPCVGDPPARKRGRSCCPCSVVCTTD